MRLFVALIASALLWACATPRPADEPTALLLGEQHDAPQHQQLHADVVQALANRAVLGALALEMAESGKNTRGLAVSATESEVQASLDWNSQAWPWQAYGPAVMATVRAGVPVLGANLPRAQMRASMTDETLDRLLPAAAMEAQRQAVREGHCNLLAEERIGPMTRIQIARDRTMAQTVATAAAAAPGRTVVLIAGAGHVDPALGVPQHLPSHLRARSEILPPQLTGKDHCAELKRSLTPRPASP